MKLLDRIKAHPHVLEVWNEGEDGWWAALKPGFCRVDDVVHCCHEQTLTALWRDVRRARVCTCRDCQPKREVQP